MDSEILHHSPRILIYLEIGEKVIRLSDVLCESATLYKAISAEVPPKTAAMLVLSIDGNEQRKKVALPDGITPSSNVVSLCYQESENPVEPRRDHKPEVFD
jgi:hypothetical protein